MRDLFVESGTKVLSSTRLIFICGMAWAMIFVTAGAFALKWTPTEVIAVFAALSGVFVGLKLGQKPMEEKLNQK